MMSDKQTLRALNELYATERFSLANYLRYAKPWVAPSDQYLAEAIRRVSDQQLEYAERVGALIIDRRGRVEGGSFPLRFTAFNDLSLPYLASHVMEDQQRIVRQLSEVARQLRVDAVACDLMNEILDAEQSHLDDICDLLERTDSDRCHQLTVAERSERRCKDATHNVATAA